MGFNPTQRQADIAPLEGERKLVTVMFADVAQSSRLVAGQDPEDADERLLSILQTMIEVVDRYGGTVNQILGDGVMALFGAPRAQEDHAVRACLAAHAMHDALSGAKLGSRSQSEACAPIRVGISSGEVVVKQAGSGLDLKYRATGEAVYLAQRMEKAAPSGVTLLSGETRALAADRVRVAAFGSVRLQPDSEPVEALSLMGVDPGRRRSDTRADGSPVFIGRRRTLGSLRDALDDANDGRGKTVVISGEAGIGKSRLIQEFLRDLGERQATVISTHSLPAGLAGPGEPTARILRCLMEAPAGREAMELGEQVTRWLGTLGLGAGQARWALCDILGLSVNDAGWRGLDPPEQLRIAVEAACRVICEESRRRLLILVFEDFHWADTETRLLAEELAGRIDSSRILIFVASRSHHGKPWTTWPATVEHEIRRLSRTHTDRFLGALLGSDPRLLDLKRLLARKTEGNPFFLEECVRALMESGYLRGNAGACRPAAPLDHVDIPGTIHGVLAGRIDSLSDPERAVLLAASVIGQRFDVGLLRELTQQPRDELLSRLNHLQQAGFVERTRIMPNLEYSFRHALIHEVAYGTLLKRKRRELHAWLVTAIERRTAAQLSGRIELLAHHARAAETWAKAAAYGRRAGLRAQSKSANREAVEYFLNGLEALQALPRTRRSLQRGIDFKLELVQSLLPLGRHEDALGQLEAAEGLASEIDDGRRLAKATSGLSLYYWVRGDLEQADRRGRKALAMAEQLKDSNSLIQISSRLGGSCRVRSEEFQRRFTRAVMAFLLSLLFPAALPWRGLSANWDFSRMP